MCFDSLLGTALEAGNPPFSATECQILSELLHLKHLADVIRGVKLENAGRADTKENSRVTA